MTKREEEQKYQRKIEELHLKVEQVARELSQLESAKQQAIQDRDKAVKDKESLDVQISTAKDELQKLNDSIATKHTAQDNHIASQNIKRQKVEEKIRSLSAEHSKLASQVQKKRVLAKDLVRLEKKHFKVLAAYRKLLAYSETARAEAVKARKQARQAIDVSAKILRQAKEREARCHARENAISKAQKKVSFYANRINKWNESRGLKPINFEL